MNTIQNLINKVNAKQDFTFVIGHSRRYVAGCQTLFEGTNPSQQYNNIYEDFNNLNNIYDTIGGWSDSETGIYYVDYCKSYNNLFDAIEQAKLNNEIAIYDTIENKEIIIQYNQIISIISYIFT